MTRGTDNYAAVDRQSQMGRAADWVRYWRACLSPESRLGALRAARSEGVLREVLNALHIGTAQELLEALHQKRDPNAD